MEYEKLGTKFQKDNIVNAADGTLWWFGDPCYVVPNDMWDVWCDRYIAYEKANPDLPRCYIAQCHDQETGYDFYTWSTAYGDGSYRLFVKDEQVAMLGVDAGTLSAIPMTLIYHWNKTGRIGDYEEMGHVVDGKHCQGEMTMDQGDLFWGDVRLPTGGLDEEEEDDEWMDETDDDYYRAMHM